MMMESRPFTRPEPPGRPELRSKPEPSVRPEPAGKPLASMVALVAVGVVTAAVAYLLGARTWHLAAAGPYSVQERVGVAVSVAVMAVGAAAACWYALSCLWGMCVLAASLMRRGAARLRGTGGPVRGRRWGRVRMPMTAPGIARIVSAGAGAAVAVSLSLAPATAAPADSEHAQLQGSQVVSLAWGAGPSVDAGATASAVSIGAPALQTSAAATQTRPGASSSAAQTSTRVSQSAANADAAPAPRQRGESLTVKPADTLWGLTAGLLGPGASDQQIARAWPQLYHANRAAIGADPEIIRPGMVLKIPESLAHQSPSDPDQSPSDTHQSPSDTHQITN